MHSRAARCLKVILLSPTRGRGAQQAWRSAAGRLVNFIDLFLQVLFKIVSMVMKLAPLGAGAGIAFTVGKYGIDTLWSLGRLMLALAPQPRSSSCSSCWDK